MRDDDSSSSEDENGVNQNELNQLNQLKRKLKEAEKQVMDRDRLLTKINIENKRLQANCEDALSCPQNNKVSNAASKSRKKIKRDLIGACNLLLCLLVLILTTIVVFLFSYSSSSQICQVTPESSMRLKKGDDYWHSNGNSSMRRHSKDPAC
jgi:hypothetical protein